MINPKIGTILIADNDIGIVEGQINNIIGQTYRSSNLVVIDNSISDTIFNSIQESIRSRQDAEMIINILRAPGHSAQSCYNVAIQHMVDNIDIFSIMEGRSLFSVNKNENIVKCLHLNDIVLTCNGLVRDNRDDLILRRSSSEVSITNENTFLYNPCFTKNAIKRVRTGFDTTIEYNLSIYKFMLTMFRHGLHYCCPDITDTNVNRVVLSSQDKEKVINDICR